MSTLVCMLPGDIFVVFTAQSCCRWAHVFRHHPHISFISIIWSPPTYAYINFWYEVNAYPLIFFQNGEPQTHVQRLSQTRQRVSQKPDRTAHMLIVWLLTHEKWPRPWSVPLTCELVKAKVWTIGRQRVVNCSCMYITTDSWKLLQHLLISTRPIGRRCTVRHTVRHTQLIGPSSGDYDRPQNFRFRWAAVIGYTDQ